MEMFFYDNSTKHNTIHISAIYQLSLSLSLSLYIYIYIYISTIYTYIYIILNAEDFKITEG